MDTSPAPRCSRCETLPAPMVSSGRLHLWFPLGHTYGKVLPFLVEQGCRFDLISKDHCAIIAIGETDREAIFQGLEALLSPEELRDTRALLVAGDEAPSLSDYARVTTLQQLLRVRAADWLVEMIEAERYTSYFQPIVKVTDPRSVFAHEALFRGFEPDGTLIPPGRIFDLGREAGLLFQLDLQARRSAIRQMARYGAPSTVFINFNPSSIYDPAFCLRSTLRCVEESGLRRDQVVFEVVESDQAPNVEHLAAILDYYRAQGFRVALDDLGSGFSSLNVLSRLKPDFVKLDMALIRGVDADPYKAVILEKLLTMAHELNVETVAEGIETEGEFAWIKEHGATYAQGYMFGRPAPAPLGGLAAAM
ncbi:MAG: EAL domain-containing protein [Candidatus Sericytochromatia bacterium]